MECCANQHWFRSFAPRGMLNVYTSQNRVCCLALGLHPRLSGWVVHGDMVERLGILSVLRHLLGPLLVDEHIESLLIGGLDVVACLPGSPCEGIPHCGIVLLDIGPRARLGLRVFAGHGSNPILMRRLYAANPRFV